MQNIYYTHIIVIVRGWWNEIFYKHSFFLVKTNKHFVLVIVRLYLAIL